ncbi:hypothetical protein C8Q80DRAFT_114749 [Daedaleopsis nitida]|nr:hypothetical protein C8Q80DRAFT_114749 [Daedaleopsis nitida]
MKPFLINLIRTSLLATVFDRAAAARNLHRIPCVVRLEKPRSLLRKTFSGERYAVQDLISAVQCEDASALDRGILFLNHILQRHIAIDIGVLCDILDYLCSALLIARFFQKNRTLHGLTLPKSWLARFIDIEGLSNKQTRRWEEYTTRLGLLLRWVYTGGQDASHLLFEKMDLSDHRLGRTRVIYFERICKNLCFYAQNSSSWRLKEDVVRMINAVSQHSQRPMTTRYTDAGDWPGMLKHGHLLTSSMNLSAFKIRYLQYTQTEEIATLLKSAHIAMLSSDSVYADEPSRQRPFSKSTRGAPDGPREHNSPMHDPSSRAENDSDDESDNPQMEFTEQERNAARIISVAYRKYLARKAADKDTVTVMRQRTLNEYKAKSEGMTWSNLTYRQLFRLAVPRLLMSTELLKDHLHGAKAHTKTKLRNVKHEELEDVQGELDEVSRLFKEACSLHKGLVPIAQIHKTCDLDELKGRARRVEALQNRVEDSEKTKYSLPWRVDIQDAMALLQGVSSASV